MLQFECIPFQDLDLAVLYQLLRLRQEIFIVEQTCPYLDADGMDEIALHVLGWNKDRQLLAYARIIPEGQAYPDFISIGRVCTHTTIRNRQQGRKLMAFCLEQCELRNPGRSIKISAQHYLENFYHAFGFEKASKIYLEDEIPHIAMILDKS